MNPPEHALAPWDGQAYSLKRHGLTIANCDAEPIQTPGCIQWQGALLVLRIADLTILQASENAQAWLGHAPAALLGRPVAVIVGGDGEAQLARQLATGLTERNPAFALTVPAAGERPALDVSLHTVQGVAVVELEPASPAALPDYYPMVKEAIGRLQTAGSLVELSQIVCDQVARISGLDRVMVYKFHDDGHGEVLTEHRRPDLPPWRGLHYPAEDIPAPAREVFRQIWLRPVCDASAPVAELVPLTNPDTGLALTMTHCVLRGASVMYTEYLQNMGVAASLTMPIRRGDVL